MAVCICVHNCTTQHWSIKQCSFAIAIAIARTGQHCECSQTQHVRIYKRSDRKMTFRSRRRRSFINNHSRHKSNRKNDDSCCLHTLYVRSFQRPKAPFWIACLAATVHEAGETALRFDVYGFWTSWFLMGSTGFFFFSLALWSLFHDIMNPSRVIRSRFM